MRFERAIEPLRLGVENVLLHKLRSLLTTLGIVFGVGSVIAMLSVGEGASRDALEQISRLGSRNIIVSSMKPASQTGNSVMESHMSLYGLLYEDLRRVTEILPTVTGVVPSKVVRMEARYGTRALDVRLVGTTPGWFTIVTRPLLTGRTLTDADMQERRAVVVLSESVARALLGAEYATGEFIRIGQNAYEVVGVIQTQGSTGQAVASPDAEGDVYAPLDVVRERYGDVSVRRSSGSRSRERVELHEMVLQVDDLEHVEATAGAVSAMLARFHKSIDYNVSVPLALLRQAEQTKRTFNIVLGSIACISLLVGGIGIMNIMLASVTERTREIGIRRAIGARKGQIVAQFLIETVVLSTAGGLIGIAVGVGIPALISHFASMPTVVTTWSVLLALGISVTIGVVFGIYPANRAANLDPIVALRHE